MEKQDLCKNLEELDKKLIQLKELLKLDEKKIEIEKLSKIIQEPHFWNNQENATQISKQLSDLQAEQNEWDRLYREVSDLLEMLQFDNVDMNMKEELEMSYNTIRINIDSLEFKTLLNGKYDKKNALITIQSGSGGTEAQDWVEMLLRMYMRYAEKKNWRVTLLDESKGQEAGYKSVTFRIEGSYVYGHMKSEHGTHRLVRISPFDAEKMRHTSFARVEVIPEIEEVEMKINEHDLRIDTFMAGGHGGQSVNTTYSAVRIVHIPTGTTVQCQNEKSQLQNKKVAMKILLSRLQKLHDDKEEEERLKLRGEYKSPEWGNQIRNYVLHPYHMVKDVRTKYETTDDEGVLDGDIDLFIEHYLRWSKK